MRPWLLLGLGLLVAAAGLGWMSSTVLRLDQRALVSENSRLALWRMDLALARLTSAESTRPPRDYLPGSLALSGGTPQHVRLHFDVSPAGLFTTPQLGLEARLEQLRPALPPPAHPIAMNNAGEGTRNAGEFNRRAAIAMNNFAPPEREAPEAAMAPAWYGEALVLARRVRLADGVHLQGAWLDWEALEPSLLNEVKDLLPEARLEPVRGHQQADALMLASLPLRLVPGAPAQPPGDDRASIGWVIAAAWVSLAVVALALGALLFGALSLDARRAAFVSAVTHELRTPLTTFKLYAEMLEDGMVPPEKQKVYLSTLRQEANRLGYLVENVLSYAQIEKGRTRKPLETVRCDELLERILPRLAARAQAQLEVGPVPAVTVKADRVSVEQILFNLVDNACKYARGISIRFLVSDDRLLITVADEGPGVSPEVERRLFEPLRKSAAEAADGARGIGLGLALSRRLARAMGGELSYRRQAGASFELSLVRVTNV